MGKHMDLPDIGTLNIAEQRALALWDEGLSFERIAPLIGRSKRQTANMLSRLLEGDETRRTNDAMQSASAALRTAILTAQAERRVEA